MSVIVLSFVLAIVSFSPIAHAQAVSRAEIEEVNGLLIRLSEQLVRLSNENESLRRDVDELWKLLPPGTVIALANEDGCSQYPGWEPYDEAKGKFIVGAGDGTGQLLPRASINDAPAPPVILSERKYGAEGGEEEHILREEEMPSHNHGEALIREYDGSLGVSSGAAWKAIEQENKKRDAGDGIPHNNMPPYIALYFCKKEG